MIQPNSCRDSQCEHIRATMLPKPFQLGSISTGTLKTEELIPPFVEALKTLSPDHDLVHTDWEHTDDDLGELVQDLEEALSAFCPPFVYFGARDGADFGFWPDWANINDALAPHWPNQLGPWECQTEQTIVQLPGIDLFVEQHITVLDLDRNILWSTV